MASYRRVYDSRHLQADCKEPGSAPEPYARHWTMGDLCLYLPVVTCTALVRHHSADRLDRDNNVGGRNVPLGARGDRARTDRRTSDARSL